MTRKLTFVLEDHQFEVAVVKVDREKLYGRKETAVVDHRGRPLQKGYLDEWGTVLIQSTAMGYLDEASAWHGRGDLLAVDGDGGELELYPASFDAPVVLRERVPLDDFCRHEITAVYLLDGFEIAAFAGLLAESADLFCFPFCYRASYDPKPAFLNPVGEKVFLMVGSPTQMPYLMKAQVTELEAGEEDEDEDLDFSMM